MKDQDGEEYGEEGRLRERWTGRAKGQEREELGYARTGGARAETVKAKERERPIERNRDREVLKGQGTRPERDRGSENNRERNRDNEELEE